MKEKCACRIIREVWCPCTWHWMCSKIMREHFDEAMKHAGITNSEITAARGPIEIR